MANGVAPDGSPVEVYLRLRPGEGPALIDRVIPRRSSILELGCGVGRIGAELMALGHEVVGVDESAEMLSYARGRLVEVVETRIEDLRLERRFDVVVLASHLISTSNRAQRQAFWRCCADHVNITGTVIVERYDPVWVRAAAPHRAVDGDVLIELHDVHHGDDTLRAIVTYRVGDREWNQRLRAAALDDAAFLDEARAVDLIFASWLDANHEWASFTQSRSSVAADPVGR